MYYNIIASRIACGLCMLYRSSHIGFWGSVDPKAVKVNNVAMALTLQGIAIVFICNASNVSLRVVAAMGGCNKFATKIVYLTR